MKRSNMMKLLADREMIVPEVQTGRRNLQTIVVIDDDPIVGEGVATGIARKGRRVILCRDVEGASLVMENESVDAVVTDIQFRGDFSFEGLDLLEILRRGKSDLPIFLMSGAGHEGLGDEAIRRGASGFFHKPFSVDELEKSLPSPGEESSEESRVDLPELDDLIEAGLIQFHFQPVIRLSTEEQIGFEALARPRTESLFRNPELLFRYAVESARTIELESVCVQRAIELSAKLSPGKLLFLNLHPASLESRSIVYVIEQGIASSGFDPSRLVLEITEHGALQSDKSLEQVEALKSIGVGFALDDVGTAFSHLPHIDTIEPSWIKISQVFGTDFETDPTRTRIVRSVLNLASSFDTKVILEGIETPGTADAARELGIEFGQGYHFARPASIDTFETA